MRPSPKLAKQCRLSEGYGHKNAWLPTGSVLCDMAFSLSSVPLGQLPSLAGQEHGRTIPLTEMPAIVTPSLAPPPKYRGRWLHYATASA